MQNAINRGAMETIEDFLVSCQTKPLSYVLGAFEWGKGDLSGRYPDKWQIEYLEAIEESFNNGAAWDKAIKTAVKTGHGTGKTTLNCWLILWFLSCFPDPKGVVIANTWSQLKGTTWAELGKWYNKAINKHLLTYTATKLSRNDAPSTNFIEPRSWNEHNTDTFQGLHSAQTFILFDEASNIADNVWVVAQGACSTTPVLWAVTGNPTRNTGRFYDCFNRFAHTMTYTATVDSRDASAVQNKGELSQYIEDMGEDSDEVRVRVKGEFPRASSSQFIPTSAIQDAMKRDRLNMNMVHRGAIVIGVDVARFGEDMSVICVRQGDVILDILSFNGLDNVQLAKKVIEVANRVNPQRIFVDETGTGSGVIDYLKEVGFSSVAEGVNFSWNADDINTYANKRCEIYGNLRDWLKKGGQLPHNDAVLKSELESVDYLLDNKGRFILESKDKIKKKVGRSPDRADALALTFSRPVASAAVLDRVRELNQGFGVIAECSHGDWF